MRRKMNSIPGVASLFGFTLEPERRELGLSVEAGHCSRKDLFGQDNTINVNYFEIDSLP
jgi:hypothetical protein